MMVQYNFEKAKEFTDNKLSQLRERLSEVLSTSKYKDSITLVTTGSYGRGEASDESDLDWFIIFDKDLDAKDAIPDEINSIAQVVTELIKNDAGDSKTFGEEAIVRFSDMQQNIGGQHDTNASLTRRMLFLLEGSWLYGEDRFKQYRRSLLEKYIKPDASNEQLPRFFLNDLIRYYRTIATDFEFKTSESGKSWGLRNIKLRFSRKLLYFGGVIVVAELNQLEREQKIEKAEELFDLDALTRIKTLGENCGHSQIVLELYETFLNKISESATREALVLVEKEKRMDSEPYKALRQSSIKFSEALHDWLQQKYPDCHPIHHALVF